jgi:hypothetical protein
MMKKCSTIGCGIKPLNRFYLTDFGKPSSQCLDCVSKRALDRYYKKKKEKEEKLNLTSSEVRTKYA